MRTLVAAVPPGIRCAREEDKSIYSRTSSGEREVIELLGCCQPRKNSVGCGALNDESVTSREHVNAEIELVLLSFVRSKPDSFS